MKIDYTNPLFFWAYIWQFPQVIAALFILIFIRERETYENNGIVVHRIPVFGSACFSLGPFIFTVRNVDDDIAKHEAGHSWQSLFLGPLYLFVVGIPSAILFIRRRLMKKNRVWYYSHYPENWANKLGGVEYGDH